MYTALSTLLDRLENGIPTARVIRWGSPIPSFGDPSRSRVASVGLNPSNREFLDEAGNELQGLSRRFHTLNSLDLNSWLDADTRHLRLILDTCCNYFNINPYDTWFRKLDYVVSATNTSYYDSKAGACHLDLIPYATRQKWTDLSSVERSALFSLAEDTMAALLQESPIRILVLNGRSVVQEFERLAGIRLARRKMLRWTLYRRSGKHVAGYAYQGTIESLGGVHLGRTVLVLGYNHNIQSSFGVTRTVIQGIREWIERATLVHFK